MRRSPSVTKKMNGATPSRPISIGPLHSQRKPGDLHFIVADHLIILTSALIPRIPVSQLKHDSVVVSNPGNGLQSNGSSVESDTTCLRRVLLTFLGFPIAGCPNLEPLREKVCPARRVLMAEPGPPLFFAKIPLWFQCLSFSTFGNFLGKVTPSSISRSGKKFPGVAATTVRHNYYLSRQGLTSRYNRGIMLRPSRTLS